MQEIIDTLRKGETAIVEASEFGDFLVRHSRELRGLKFDLDYSEKGKVKLKPRP